MKGNTAKLIVTRLRLIKSKVSNGFVLRHLTLDFSRLLKVGQTPSQFQRKVLKKKHRFSQNGSRKGIAAGAVAGGSVACSSGRNDDSGFESQVTANQECGGQL